MTNIVPFPKKPCFLAPSREGPIPHYEFTDEELGRLCRWYSAMRYAFPKMQAVMAVCHDEKVSAIGLYGEGGATPSCLLSKHEAEGRTYLLWATDQDSPRVIGSLSEITDAQIIAIAPPRNEASWLDAGGWMKVFANRTIAGAMRNGGFSPSPA
jgi:hypothetical protein